VKNLLTENQKLLTKIKKFLSVKMAGTFLCPSF